MGAARARARSYSAEAFEAQTGKKLPVGAAGSSEEVADSLAAQWAAQVEKTDPELAVVRTAAARDLEWAATRTATTETMQAFNDQSREAFDALFSRGVHCVRIWNSALEVNTCEVCLGLHGEQADALGNFPQGDPPTHPRCLCWCTTELL